MKNEPVRISAAVLILGAALIALGALIFNWDAEVVAGIGFVWAAVIGVVDAIIVRNKVTPVE